MTMEAGLGLGLGLDYCLRLVVVSGQLKRHAR
jgi:hypothetical protein